jgi:hypothetical protein
MLRSTFTCRKFLQILVEASFLSYISHLLGKDPPLLQHSPVLHFENLFDLSHGLQYNSIMRDWNVPASGPLSLRIAADARLTVPDYIDDQIWELTLAGGEPPAVALQTSYGLRVRSMRLFPGFMCKDVLISDPAQFASAPVVRRFLPNYLRVDYSPFDELGVVAEYWVPFILRNKGKSPAIVRLRLYALLNPREKPQSMSPVDYGGVKMLSGTTDGLALILFLGGGATVEQAAYPALGVSCRLQPGAEKKLIWAQAAFPRAEASYEAVRNIAASSWDGEIAHLELLNEACVDIETGDPEWDVAMALSQKVALGSLIGPTRSLRYPSLVNCRLPDHGYSARGDGRDYNWQWNGQTAADAFLCLPLILPAAPELAKGVMRNFVYRQRADGFVDRKPGLGGQTDGALSPPLLATMTWKIYEHTEDRVFLEEMLPYLLNFFEAWFGKDHDRDQDGFPEWDNVLQAGFDNWPSFVRWHKWGQGLEISKAETPDLASYLYRESRALQAMARCLGREELLPDLKSRADYLREAIEESWSEKKSCYQHRDRNTHITVKGKALGKGKGEFILKLDRSFDDPVRILVRVVGKEELSRRATVFVHGRGRRGRGGVERISDSKFQWFWNYGTATSERTYCRIEKIEVRGLSKEFKTEIRTADFSRQDQTLLLPLWAGIPETERAEALIKKTLLDPERYWRSSGIPLCPACDKSYAPDNQDGAGAIAMLWNVMLGEGLINYDHRQEAAQLMQRMMEVIVHTLREDKAFRQFYVADRPEGIGDYDTISGLAPVGLFLQTLGVRLISPTKLRLEGYNLFPWPVVVRWKGLKIRRDGNISQVTFPNGQSIQVTGEEPQVLEQGG